MAVDHTSHSQIEEPEDDRLLDIWLFTLFALSVFILVLFVAPRGCHQALQEKAGAKTTVLLPTGAPLSLSRGSFNYNLARFLASKDDTAVPKTFVVDHLDFESNTTQLTPESTATLDNLIVILKAYPSAKVQVEGHTDNRGDVVADKTRSIEQAEQIRSLLIKNGVAARRVAATGYGQGKPVASNDTEEGRARNRRIELVVVKK